MNIKLKIKYLAAIAVVMAILPMGYSLAQVNDVNVLYGVLELIKKVYVKEVTDKELAEAAISGMLTSLDPHSSFLNKKELEEMKESVKGEFGGIGVEIMTEPQGLRVISPIDDTPAFKAGVQPKDLIFAINDDLIGNMTPADAIKKMRGPKGSKLKIGIVREGMNEPLEINLARDIIKVNPVKSHLYGDIGYIRLATFSDKTADSVRLSVESMQKQAGSNEIKGYVLDMRNNPGGILDQSVKVADFFLNNGLIVSTKNREGKNISVFNAQPNSLINESVPLVVLINGGSASASEIVAGALQDHKRALVLGTKSFGKGSVQTIIEIPDYGAVRITTALYYTPSGKSIQAEGIIPDIIVEQAKVELLSNADKKLQFSEAKLKNHLRNSEENSVAIKAKTLTDVTKSQSEIWKTLYEKDYQLARAIDTLKSMELLKKW
jgi:carboxyl-terminal processing protease